MIQVNKKVIIGGVILLVILCLKSCRFIGNNTTTTTNNENLPIASEESVTSKTEDLTQLPDADDVQSIKTISTDSSLLEKYPQLSNNALQYSYNDEYEVESSVLEENMRIIESEPGKNKHLFTITNDNTQNIKGVSVRIYAATKKGKTKEANYRYEFIPAGGDVNICVDKDGYLNFEVVVTVEGVLTGSHVRSEKINITNLKFNENSSLVCNVVNMSESEMIDTFLEVWFFDKDNHVISIGKDLIKTQGAQDQDSEEVDTSIVKPQEAVNCVVRYRSIK